MMSSVTLEWFFDDVIKLYNTLIYYYITGITTDLQQVKESQTNIKGEVATLSAEVKQIKKSQVPGNIWN